jgi:glycerol-3-phosphate dehydrogenase (NAD(P)+)
MSLHRAIALFEGSRGFQDYKKQFVEPVQLPLNTSLLRDTALKLVQRHEPRGDRSELQEALSELSVSQDTSQFKKLSPILAYLGQSLFKDISRPIPEAILKRIKEFQGPIFFFVAHTSYFDYVHTAALVRRLGMLPPVLHVTGTVTGGKASQWLAGFRTLTVPKSFSSAQHRAYAWFCAALAEAQEQQILFARTSRYSVRSREGILREPYVPHGVICSVKATGKALVVPVAVSYSTIPEDTLLVSPRMLPYLWLLPPGWGRLLPNLLGFGSPEKVLNRWEGSFGEVSTDVGEPFELADDNSLILKRISHLAIEAIARNKLIHPSHLVAKALHDLGPSDIKKVRERVEEEVATTQTFFKTRYRQDAPLHPLLTSDITEAVHRGVKALSSRGAVTRSVFRRTYKPSNSLLLRFYAYHGDRRIYPLRGRNTMAVINAGIWGYTLALHIGKNLLKKPELAEHSLILYDSREDLIEKLTVESKHPWHFKDVDLPRSVRPEADLIAAVGDTSLILMVTPSKYFHATLVKLLETAPEGSDLIIATKGFIPETGLLPCQTAHREMERLGKKMRVGILSGANLAHEVALGGAGVTQIACEQPETFERLRNLIETPRFRVVYSADVIGTTICAALKNVYAIGYGLLEGSKKAPENFLATYATLVTAEIRQFGLLLGAHPETFDAESQVWMADLLATCRGGRSARYGRELAEMEDKQGKLRAARVLLEQYRKKRIAVEGFEATRFAQRMASQRGFHPPILGEIYSILHGGKQLDVEAFIEKCLDALAQGMDRTSPSTVRYRYSAF